MTDKESKKKKTGEDLMRELAGDFWANKAGLKHERQEAARITIEIQNSVEDVARSKEAIKIELFDQLKKIGDEIKLIVYIERGRHVLIKFARMHTIADSRLTIDLFEDIKSGYAMHTVKAAP